MPIHVLLIEDNRPDALIVRDALRRQRLDFFLKEISDAEEAFVYIRQMGRTTDAPYPDIVIMDLNLPCGSGFEVLEALRKRPVCVHTPVIVMTSSESPEDRAKASQLGNTYYFRKPHDLDAFLEVGAIVREVLKGNRASA